MTVPIERTVPRPEIACGVGMAYLAAIVEPHCMAMVWSP